MAVTASVETLHRTYYLQRAGVWVSMQQLLQFRGAFVRFRILFPDSPGETAYNNQSFYSAHEQSKSSFDDRKRIERKLNM